MDGEYFDNIKSIREYFKVSEYAARYMYRIRMLGYPYKKSYHKNYIEWSVKLQNALVSSDLIDDFNWGDLKNVSDINTLSDYGININIQPYTVLCNKTRNMPVKNNPINNEWTVVNKTKKREKKHIVKNLGFLV